MPAQQERPLAGPASRPERGNRRARRTAALIATFALAAVFTYLAVQGVHWHKAWQAVEHCNAWMLVPAFGAFVIQTLLRAMRWRSLFAPGRRPRRGPVIAATLIGYLFNNIMPARAGEAARVVSLTRDSPVPPAEIIGTVVVERAYDVFAVLLIFFCAVPWLPSVSWFGAAAVLAGVAAAGLAAVVAVLAIYGDRPLQWLARPLARFPRLTAERVRHHVALLADGLSGLREHRVALEAFVWSIAAWMVTAVWAWCVLLAFHSNLPFSAGVLVTVAVGLSMIIPSPPAAVGVFEAAGVLALKAYGLSATAALPCAVVLHVSNFVPLVLAGAITLQFVARRPARRARAATYT
ncbi:MAG: lysylphosphatidylglycerol synthase transmembrane domain-containing protein [Solirubrobacteraceae bacterium]|jgi:uncharacterized protein (TIRG00374 family)